MTEEEKEVYIKYCKYDKEPKEIILNLISVIEKQNKIINLMAEQLTTPINSKEWVIKYWEKEAEKC